uniref:Uncharacterized protein n=1 Tax=Romanomermis culicivorax TaxID=13658 RepID=A0A915JJK9_ROMCU
MPMDRRCEI